MGKSTHRNLVESCRAVEPRVLDATRGHRFVWLGIHAMKFAKTHEDGCGSETNRLFTERRGHLSRLHDVCVEAVVRVLEKT